MEQAEYKITTHGLDALHTLHVRCMDASAGFEKMLEKSEPEFRPVAQRFLDLHRSHAARLANMLVNHGEQPDENGSFMSTVNRAVVATRALFDEIDEDVMDQVRSGEEYVLDAFAEASEIEDESLHPQDKAAIDEMRGELGNLLQETVSLG